MIRTKKQSLIVIGVFTLVLALVTTTYAFFNYARTGTGNTIRVGRISFVSKNEETISLNNLFPIDPSNTSDLNDNTKVGTYSIDIKGDTDYVDGIEYLVSAVDANIYTSEGQIVPITLDFTVTDLGDPSANYFTARENTNASIYKRLVGDTLKGDEQLLVGYIKPNTQSGTAEGVDGSITIKAYLDKNKILISDTYDGTESDNMGTPNSLAEGKTVLTTSEWNALKTSGISFKVKVEANEGIWVEEIRTLYGIMQDVAVMDNVSSTYVSAGTGIDFGAISSDTNGKGVYERAGTENDEYPIYYYRGEIDNNNVLFANKCWKAVRTTDTGGVKLIYNGESTGTIDEPNCNNTGTNTHISVNVNGTPKKTFAFNTNYNSPAYNGYMFGTVYTDTNASATSGAYFGSSFTYDGTNYTLVDATTAKNNTHHYTCNLTTADGTCTTLRYYYFQNYYVNLTGGDGIEEALTKMQTNTNDSNAKDKIDTWYASNLTSYTNKLEDTIWCNDRSMGDGNNNGLIANGGDLDTYLYYGATQRSNYASNTSTVKNQPSLACANKNDSFTVSNANGNQALTYPVAMITEDEAVLAGGLAGTENTTFYLNNGSYYWSLSPDAWGGYAVEFIVDNGYVSSDIVTYTHGLRPAVSLKPGTLVASGTGIVSDPFVIE